MNRRTACTIATLLLSPAYGAATAIAGAMPLPETPAGQIAARVDAALQAENPLGNHRLELDNPMLSPPRGVNAEDMRVESLAYDGKSGRVTATLASASGPERVRVNARIYQLIDIVVPSHPIDAGAVISDRDLERSTIRLDATAPDALVDPSTLIGKTPRHALRAHEAVHAFDLQMPLVIHRGDMVTMSLEMPLMMLTTQGQALEDAAQGAALRVTNIKSSRIVEAVATGPGLATVAPPKMP